MEQALADSLIQIFSIPFLLIHNIVTGILGALIFDVLQLGPFLPITL